MSEEKKLGDYVKDNKFGNGKAFPVGNTKLVLADCTVDESSFTDSETGVVTPKWIIHSGEDSFRAGTRVMDGIKDAQEKGAKSVIVIKKGEGLKTNYMVVNTDEIA